LKVAAVNFILRPGRPKKVKIIKEYTPEQKEFIKNAQSRFGIMDDEKLNIAGFAFYRANRRILNITKQS
jgi:hypothetical protein